jgi:Mg2+ and Co2+ transporter CorA
MNLITEDKLERHVAAQRDAFDTAMRNAQENIRWLKHMNTTASAVLYSQDAAQYYRNASIHLVAMADAIDAFNKEQTK